MPKDSKTNTITVEDNETQSLGMGFGCTLCGETFHRAIALRHHLKDIHSFTLSGYACPVEGCGKVDAQLSNMKTHLRTHCNTKDNFCGLPYPNDPNSECQFECTDPSSMNRHIASKHELREGGKARNASKCPVWLSEKIRKRKEEKVKLMQERRLTSKKAKPVKVRKQVAKTQHTVALDTAMNSNSTSSNRKVEVPSPIISVDPSSSNHEDADSIKASFLASHNRQFDYKTDQSTHPDSEYAYGYEGQVGLQLRSSSESSFTSSLSDQSTSSEYGYDNGFCSFNRYDYSQLSGSPSQEGICFSASPYDSESTSLIRLAEFALWKQQNERNRLDLELHNNLGGGQPFGSWYD